jgi:calcineurin-like phosphoesterase family protein
MAPYDVRIHGHIHNNGYTRDAFVPFLKQHINLSVEQTKYRPVNLKLLLDAYLYGEYPETTEEQLADARARKEERSQ